MQTFQYVARDSNGVRKEGIHQAGSSADVVTWLREQGMTAVAVDEIAKQAKVKSQPVFSKRIKSADLAALCWQLSTMIEGGVPITDAIASIKQDSTNSSLGFILGRILEKITHGETFSTAVDEFPNVFNVMSRAIILAGETSGTLTASLKRLGEYYDTRDKLKKKVQMATAYPIFVICFVVVIVVVLMTFIVPRFRAIFAQFHGDLPAFTKAFIGFYDLLRFNAIYVIAFVIIAAVFLVSTIKFTKSGHMLFSRFVLTIPILGGILSQAFVVTLCRTMSTLLSSGVSVLDVFDILSGMTKNDVIKNAVFKGQAAHCRGDKYRVRND